MSGAKFQRAPYEEYFESGAEAVLRDRDLVDIRTRLERLAWAVAQQGDLIADLLHGQQAIIDRLELVIAKRNIHTVLG